MNKKFDCVEMKHKGAFKINGKTSKLSANEELLFWKNESEELHKRKKMITKKNELTK